MLSMALHTKPHATALQHPGKITSRQTASSSCLPKSWSSPLSTRLPTSPGDPLLRPPGRTMTQLRPLFRKYFSACMGTRVHSQMMQLVARHAHLQGVHISSLMHSTAPLPSPLPLCSAYPEGFQGTHISGLMLSMRSGCPPLTSNLLLSTSPKLAGHPHIKPDAEDPVHSPQVCCLAHPQRLAGTGSWDSISAQLLRRL